MKLRNMLSGLAITSLMIISCSKESVEEPQVLSATSKDGSPSITITDGAYVPAEYWVVPGATVTWFNSGQLTHTVTAENGSFNSGNIAPGSSWSNTFNAVGDYDYRCDRHPEEAGTIHVVVK